MCFIHAVLIVDKIVPPTNVVLRDSYLLQNDTNIYFAASYQMSHIGLEINSFKCELDKTSMSCKAFSVLSTIYDLPPPPREVQMTARENFAILYFSILLPDVRFNNNHETLQIGSDARVSD